METPETSTETLVEPEPDTPFASEESEFVVDPSERARPGKEGGRPRADGMKPGLVAPAIDHPVPTPRIRTFKSDSTAPNATSKSAWNYWNTLPQWAKEKLVVYVYRDHPILLDPEPQDGKPQEYKYIDKIIGTEPIQDDMDLLNRYGCGTYRVVLTDPTNPKHTNKPVCTVWVMYLGGSNYRSNPPTDNRINDIEQVDLDNPANKAYVSYLRGQGKLPEQMNKGQQENEMANVQLIDKLVDKITEDRDRVPRQDDSSKRNMEINNELTKAAIQTMKEVNAYALKTRDEIDASRPTPTVVAPTPTSPTSDPVVVALEIVKMIRDERGSGSDPEVAALRHQLAQMQQSQLDSMREQVKLLMDAKVTGPSAATSPFSSMNEGLDSLRKMKAVVDEFAGAAGEDAADKGAIGEAVGDAAPKWLKPFIPLVPLFGQAIAAYLQYRNTPQPQQQYMAPPPTGYPYGPMPMPQLGPGGIPQPQPIPQPMPTSPISSIDNPNNLPPAAIEVLSSIKDSLAFHLHYGMTGSEFAGWYASQVGEPKYREVASLGAEQIAQLLTLYPATARTIQGQKAEYVTEFVNEFCNPVPEEEGDIENEPSPAV